MTASKNVIKGDILPPQIRAARALLAWSQDKLAAACALPKRTIARLEVGATRPQRRTVAAIRAALETAGVEFIPENGGGAGVRLAKPTAGQSAP